MSRLGPGFIVHSRRVCHSSEKYGPSVPLLALRQTRRDRSEPETRRRIDGSRARRARDSGGLLKADARRERD
jgi:hypothetical protein